jgi:hypothetical protein
MGPDKMGKRKKTKLLPESSSPAGQAGFVQCDPIQVRWSALGFSEFLISTLKHHYPRNQKVVAWTGPTFFDVSLQY